MFDVRNKILYAAGLTAGIIGTSAVTNRMYNETFDENKDSIFQSAVRLSVGYGILFGTIEVVKKFMK